MYMLYLLKDLINQFKEKKAMFTKHINFYNISYINVGLSQTKSRNKIKQNVEKYDQKVWKKILVEFFVWGLFPSSLDKHLCKQGTFGFLTRYNRVWTVLPSKH